MGSLALFHASMLEEETREPERSVLDQDSPGRGPKDALRALRRLALEWRPCRLLNTHRGWEMSTTTTAVADQNKREIARSSERNAPSMCGHLRAIIWRSRERQFASHGRCSLRICLGRRLASEPGRHATLRTAMVGPGQGRGGTRQLARTAAEHNRRGNGSRPHSRRASANDTPALRTADVACADAADLADLDSAPREPDKGGEGASLRRTTCTSSAVTEAWRAPRGVAIAERGCVVRRARATLAGVTRLAPRLHSSAAAARYTFLAISSGRSPE